MTDSVTVNEKGCWIQDGEHTFALLKAGSAPNVPVYVGVHVNKSQTTPYAMSFNESGELMLQIPKQDRSVKIVKMADVERMIDTIESLAKAI